MPDRGKQHKAGAPNGPQSGLPPLPPMSPIDTAALGDQVTSLYDSYWNTRQLLAGQNAGLRGMFQTQQGSIAQQRRSDIAANEGSMIERGLLGGTSQATSEADIHGAAASQLAAARNSMIQGLIANRGQAIAARSNYQGGLLNLELAAGAQQDVQGIIDQLLNNTTPGGSGGGGGGGGGNGGGGAGGGGGTGGGGGGNAYVPQPVADQLDHMKTHIHNIIDAYGNTRDQQLRLQYFNQVKEIWRKRNQLRVQSGFDPMPFSRLHDLLDAAGGPGGGPGGQA